jgi:hypothetical protein
LAFKDLDKDERLSLNRNSVRTRTTLVQRWAEMGPIASPGLVERARIAASFIKPGAWVADIGCGAMVLEPQLPPGTHYIPVDCVPRDDRTVIVDLNKGPLPDLAVDVIVGLGVLEYLDDVPSFLAQIRREAIFTYAPVENSPKHDRASSGWFNAYTAHDMDILFEQAGFEIRQRVPCPGRHILWHLQPRAPVAAAQGE